MFKTNFLKKDYKVWLLAGKIKALKNMLKKLPSLRESCWRAACWRSNKPAEGGEDIMESSTPVSGFYDDTCLQDTVQWISLRWL